MRVTLVYSGFCTVYHSLYFLFGSVCTVFSVLEAGREFTVGTTLGNRFVV